MSRTAYVMAAREDFELARAVICSLREQGYAIDNDWTQTVNTPDHIRVEDRGEMHVDLKQKIAFKNLNSAMTSDLCVLACGPHFPSIGAGVELGARLAVCGYLHVIAPPRDSVFFAIPNVHVFDTFEDWDKAFVHA